MNVWFRPVVAHPRVHPTGQRFPASSTSAWNAAARASFCALVPAANVSLCQRCAPPGQPPLDLDGGDPVAAARPSHQLCHLDPLRPALEPGAPTPARESAPAVRKGPLVIPR